MSATARTVRPFAMLASEGWQRDTARKVLDDLREGRFEARAEDGGGDRLLCNEGMMGISVAPDVHEPGNAPFDPVRTTTFATTVLETLLMRSDEDALDRIVVADRALDIAARLSVQAEEPIASGQMNAYARSRHRRAMFGAVIKWSDSWSSTMRADGKRRDLPFSLSINVSRSRISIWRRSRLIHDVVPLTTLERLRMESLLAETIARVRSMDAP
jgi:hypothetical protein